MAQGLDLFSTAVGTDRVLVANLATFAEHVRSDMEALLENEEKIFTSSPRRKRHGVLRNAIGVPKVVVRVGLIA